MFGGCCSTHSLPREEVRRFVRETPFTSREVLKLWTRFAHLDVDRSGTLILQVSLCCYDDLQCCKISSLCSDRIGGGEIEDQD